MRERGARRGATRRTKFDALAVVLRRADRRVGDGAPRAGALRAEAARRDTGRLPAVAFFRAEDLLAAFMDPRAMHGTCVVLARVGRQPGLCNRIQAGRNYKPVESGRSERSNAERRTGTTPA